MGLLKPAVNRTAYLKAGFLGFQGAGKTFTSSRIAAPLAKLSSKKPVVAMFDTEKSSDFLIDYFESQGVEFLATKSRSFKDACDFIRECEQADVTVAIVDSVTHLWKDLMDSFKRKLNRQDLYFGDWGDIKAEWQQLSDLFVNSNLHLFMLGRAGFEYDTEVNERGKKELIKTGTKMKAEGEFGYESDLLIEMMREPKKKGEGWINRAWVLKDRWDLLNGKSFDFPTFETFKPVIDRLNLGGEHFGVDLSRNSESLFGDKDWSYADQRKKRDIALEELDATLTKCDLAGTKAEVKKKRIEVLEQVYGTSSKTKIETMWAPQIEEGIKKIIGMFFEEQPAEQEPDPTVAIEKKGFPEEEPKKEEVPATKPEKIVGKKPEQKELIQ